MTIRRRKRKKNRNYNENNENKNNKVIMRIIMLIVNKYTYYVA